VRFTHLHGLSVTECLEVEQRIIELIHKKPKRKVFYFQHKTHKLCCFSVGVQLWEVVKDVWEDY
jgi:hypothetical protein